MNIEKTIQSVEGNTDPKQLMKAVIKLLEVAHSCGADKKAEKALAECGIKLCVENEATEEDEDSLSAAVLMTIKALAEKCKTLEEFKESLDKIIEEK